MQGKFIVIEGLEGAGKSTAMQTVVDTLKSLGVNDIVFTREPGGTPLAEKLRHLISMKQKNLLRIKQIINALCGTNSIGRKCD